MIEVVRKVMKSYIVASWPTCTPAPSAPLGTSSGALVLIPGLSKISPIPSSLPIQLSLLGTFSPVILHTTLVLPKDLKVFLNPTFAKPMSQCYSAPCFSQCPWELELTMHCGITPRQSISVNKTLFVCPLWWSPASPLLPS